MTEEGTVSRLENPNQETLWVRSESEVNTRLMSLLVTEWGNREQRNGKNGSTRNRFVPSPSFTCSLWTCCIPLSSRLSQQRSRLTCFPIMSVTLGYFSHLVSLFFGFTWYSSSQALAIDTLWFPPEFHCNRYLKCYTSSFNFMEPVSAMYTLPTWGCVTPRKRIAPSNTFMRWSGPI